MRVLTTAALLVFGSAAGFALAAPQPSQGSAETAPLSGTSRLETPLPPNSVVVVRGPYLQRGTPTGVVVRWRTSEPADSRVLFGPAPGNLGTTVSDPVLVLDHEIGLTGLTPDTVYYYAVGTGSEVLAGDDPGHFFLTAPTPGTPKPTRMWVLGDSGIVGAGAAAVRDAYYGELGPHTDLWLMLGDNAYPDGTDAQYQAGLFDLYPVMLRKSVLWPTIGNHDLYEIPANSWPYYDIFTLPTLGEAGGVPSGTEWYYSFDHANAHFVVLDSQNSSRSPGGAMLTWLEADLQSTTQDWIVAIWHHPPYSKGSHDSDDVVDSGGRMQDMRQNVLPILEDYGVDLVLTGHSHSYERSYLIDGHYGASSELGDPATSPFVLDSGDGNPTGDGPYRKPLNESVPFTGPGNGAVYSVAGSSSQVSGGTLDHPAMFVSLNVLGSLVIDLRANRLDVRFLDDSGLTRDEFTILKDCPAGEDGDEDLVCDAQDNCPVDSNASQTDTDSDGLGDACDGDDDADGVVDAEDIAPLDPNSCRDVDADTCDDCSSGTDAPAADGPDTDVDGECDAGDNCDEVPNPDQTDTDGDGAGDACDGDDDGDGVADAQDSQPLNPFVCRDVDLDTCDDCSSGTDAPASDGSDTDADGLCDAGDPDDDNDGVPDAQDSEPQNLLVCRDVDSDTCDDCSQILVTIFDAEFDADASGFAYLDDAFRGTNQPTYESGLYIGTGGFAGGGLRVDLGGINNTAIAGMSGGWRRVFSLDDPGRVVISFRYNMTQTPYYESGEYSEVLVSVDGVLHGQSLEDYVARIAGDGNGGPSVTTGWQQFQVDLGTLASGSHTLVIGGHNNSKDAANESTVFLLDDVLVVHASETEQADPSNDGVDTDADGLCDAGDSDDDGDGVADGQDSQPLNPYVCRDVDADTCDDCTSGTDTPGSDGTDTDADGLCDAGDPDDDGDGVADAQDSQPLNPFVCRDADADTCDDCTSGTDAPTNDGLDTDADGECDAGDNCDAVPNPAQTDTDGDGTGDACDGDDDGDGVADGQDSQPLNRFVCRDVDTDTCDDCSSGTDAPASDGTDTDADGQCNAGDPDDDNDDVPDGQDSQPLNRFVCRDVDTDTCDDCSSGTDAPASDGTDTDADGQCNAGDPDDDNDGVPDGQDSQPLNRFVCRDVDADTCDDCTSGTSAPANDGTDTDADGLCNAGDPDDDGDGVTDGQDSQPLNPFVCRDVDADTCDDCTSGTSAPANDGTDTDADGLCNAGDPDDDNDGVADGQDSQPLNRFVCRDVDTDTCDDCTSGISAPANDGTDTDTDGLCNAGDPDDDNDGVADGQDSQPLNRFVCRDVDADTCDDCTSGTDAPANDGTDTDTDGQCNAGDPDDDNDGVPDAQDSQPENVLICRDLDSDTCDDCSQIPVTVFDARFDADATGFAYLDDAFRGTNQPAYESGSYVSTGGFTGGALRVDLGGINSSTIAGMSGGWRRLFSLASPRRVVISFRYNLTQTPEYENTEYSEVLISLNGTLHGQPPGDYVARITGDGNGGPSKTTGWQQFQVDLGTLGSGSHTLVIGGYNNSKNASNESTVVLVDDVLVVSGSGTGQADPSNDGVDTDADGQCNAGDSDDDGDGVADAQDSQPLNRFICRDVDADTCDDCSSGTDAPASDGTDTDVDGLCNAGDPDDDNDGVADGQDSQPLNPFVCRDVDADDCDDCSSGTSAPANDGTDTDADGLCNAGDPDDDNDAVPDGQDSQPLDHFVCRDADGDTCDDCSSGTDAPASDGTDTDADGLCNAGDPDDDNDGVPDAQDSQPENPLVCRDLDLDTCDDCSEILTTIFDARFDADATGFAYLDDAFRGTTQPAYASGSYVSTGGFTGGAVRVDLGGINNTLILGMSGGWRRVFSLASPRPVVLSFRYNMTQTPHYESTEYSDVLISLNGVLYGQPPGDYVARITGDGNMGPSKTTGWQQFQVDLGTLASGTHTVAIGGYNNSKNSSNESTAILLDDVLVVSGSGTGQADPSNDGVDTDADGQCNAGDSDDDNDGVPDGQDQQPLNPFVCRDIDADSCEDCVSGTSAPANDGTDTDADGLCNLGDPDDDNDGVADGQDSQPLNPFVCRDIDVDTCDDCSSGTDAPANDGVDTDADGRCNAGDTDDDGDGVADGQDSQPLNRFVCRDVDADTCDDCSSGTDAPADDGADTDADGLCNAGDPDDDGDGVADGQDSQPLNRFVCRDVDTDTCDDCTSGTSAPANDGTDTDADGLCNAGDPDDDNDAVPDGQDSQPLNGFACRDVDADTCDDCSSGTDAPANDGTDTDADGLCNSGDPDDDGDGVADGQDSQPLNRFVCRDTDADTCDDCTSGTSAPANDGTDTDADGLCNAGDPDDDNDAVPDGQDSQPLNGLACRDVDADTCDDCTSGTDAPASDGTDTDADGLCNAGDPDDDNDAVPDGQDSQPLNGFACRDVDADTCDDCTSGTDAPASDGTDTDADGLCNAGDNCVAASNPEQTDTDGDGQGDTCDGDDDNDGVADEQDFQPLDHFVCRDADLDTCDDCSSGTDAPGSDGTDTDADGLCDAGDPDDDNDAVPDGQDSQPLNPFLCRDVDTDTCDDCTSGTDAPANDGTDTDSDGLCNVGDPDDDNDAVPDGQDSQPLNPFVCRDADLDTCDDCSSGTDAPSADGPDPDGDGLCDAGDNCPVTANLAQTDTDGDGEGDACDDDDDGDGVEDLDDSSPLDRFVCRDADADSCDDCASGSDDPSDDGPDWDGDGSCDSVDPQVLIEDLLDEMVDLDGLARMPDPPYVTTQTSSYDRVSDLPCVPGADCWFANVDLGHFYGSEALPGRTEYILLDAPGPGVVTRVWSAGPAGVLRVYIDGNPVPAIEESMADLLFGAVSPFLPPIARPAPGGAGNLYFPISYGSHCKITVDSPAGENGLGLYYQIGYRTYPANVPVESFSMARVASLANRIEEISDIFGDPSLLLDSVPGEQKLTGQLVANGAPLVVSPPGASGGRVRELRLRPTSTDAVTLRKTLLTLSFDGTTTVQAPLGDFFGTGSGLNVYESLPMSVEADGTLVSRWPMPFEQGMTLALSDIDGVAVVDYEVLVEPYSWSPSSLYFSASWEADHSITVHPKRDLNLVTITGQGRYVGNLLNVTNPFFTIWWGEGDEKIYVDGEPFPGHFGTGTEDYYGFGFAAQILFQHAYHDQTLLLGPGWYGRNSTNRWHVLDSIPFDQSFQFDLEQVFVTTDLYKKATLFDYVAYWYAAPGATHDHATLSPAGLTLPSLDPLLDKNIPGIVIEGETMTVGPGDGAVSIEEMTPYEDGSNLWSGHRQLSWVDGQAGSNRQFSFATQVPAAGVYRVTLHTTRAPEAGKFTFALNGQSAQIPALDLWNAGEVLEAAIDLGAYALLPGTSTLTVNEAGGGTGPCCYAFGLDALSLVPFDSDGDGVANDVDNCPSVANAAQQDGDGDGIGNVCDVCPADADNDLDQDGVCGDLDTAPSNPYVCRDADQDGCDDCLSGTDDPANDGPDGDGDGQCDVGDQDDDDDGVPDTADAAPGDPYLCRDLDGDGCDDCASGTDDPANDGPDGDGDGQCDAGDQDDDGDGVADGLDSQPLDPLVCRDADRDSCDDCSSGTDDPANDGSDGDGDGVCDATDPEDENDGTIVLDGGSTSFLANLADPGIDGVWFTPGFVEGPSWFQGPFGVGYDDDPPETGAQGLIGSGVPGGVVSVYTRTTFQIADTSAIFSLFLGADYDDGFVAWINGVEVYRSPEMRGALLTWDAAAESHESSNGTSPEFAPMRDVSLVGLPALQNGTNLLAVAVWNDAATSDDLVLVPRLVVNRMLTRRPYLQRATPTSVTLRYRTALPMDSRVLWGPQVGSLTSNLILPGTTKEHEVTISGLTPNTRYYYAVGSSAEVLAGGDAGHYFVTPPPAGVPRPTRIWVLGDSGAGTEAASAVRDAYLDFTRDVAGGLVNARHTDLWMMLGDNADPNGTDADYQESLFDVHPTMLRTSVLWPTLGTSDAYDSVQQTWPYFDLFTLPTAGEAGGVPSNTEHYYSFDVSNVHFVVLDSLRAGPDTVQDMALWLASDLEDTLEPWIIAVWHHPPYSKGSHDSDDPQDSDGLLVSMRETIVPILEDYGVDLVLAGQSHSYERSHLIDGHYGNSTTFLESMKLDASGGSEAGPGGPYEKPLRGETPYGAAPGDGAVYVVAGSSSQTTPGKATSLGGTEPDHPAAFRSLLRLGSLVLDVDGNRLDATFLDENGAVADEFTIFKGGAPAAPQADFTAAPRFGSMTLAVDFTDLSSNGPTAWSWDFENDGSFDADEPNPSHVYSEPGLYAVKLAVSNSAGATEIVKSNYVCVAGEEPGRITTLRLAGDRKTLTWQAAPHSMFYDVLRGSLNALSQTGDFASAGVTCVEQDDADLTATDTTSPAAGQALFYLVRATDCAGQGSYDAVSTTQAASRDGALADVRCVGCGVSGDTDGDGTCDPSDNCPGIANPDQDDLDADGQGDACDICPADPLGDADADGICSGLDNCPLKSNPTQQDQDGDGLGNACDVDDDGDGVIDVLDAASLDPLVCRDADADTCDDCTSGTDAPASDGTDTDSDGICDAGDNCAAAPNPAQTDTDSDGQGDVCDSDDDGDGVTDGQDSQPLNPLVCRDADADTCDDCTSGTDAPAIDGTDTDSDGICDAGDNCAATPNPLQEDLDEDGIGDACDPVDVYSSGETTVQGTATGDYSETLASDDTVEVLTEVLDGVVGPSMLDHRFTIEIAPGSSHELYVEGFRSESSDGDDFVFQYSTSGTSWTTIVLSSLPFEDDDTPLHGALPADLSGSVLIRVIDTDHSVLGLDLDSVSIDQLFVRSLP